MAQHRSPRSPPPVQGSRLARGGFPIGTGPHHPGGTDVGVATNPACPTLDSARIRTHSDRRDLNGKEVNALRPLAGMLLRRLFHEDEDGQTLVEYGLLLALITLVVFAALVLLGPIVSGFFIDMGDTIVDVT